MVHSQRLTFVIIFSAASLLTHIGATAWAAFQIVHTADFHRQFTRLTTEGACGVNLLPTYWKERANADGAARPEPALRIAVESGGCHGYQYKLQVDHNRAPDD